MKAHENKAQVRFVTTKQQAAAIDRVSKARNISKMALMREAAEMVTGVGSDAILDFPRPRHEAGLVAYNERRRKQREEVGN